MLTKLIQFSLKFRGFVLVAAGLLLVVGGLVAARTPVDVLPDLTAPSVTVLTEAPGFAPEEVELLVTFPLESVLNGAPGVRRLRSVSGAGVSVIWVLGRVRLGTRRVPGTPDRVRAPARGGAA